ncbi:8720_t:CDS:1 [Cetraspora pellucida]|uniref:8720_t:CDS:1 n=1 Tax=Cetraspora pellucida TaxID=1433469 RepID=A0A9N8W375_9GLOM|nr:8720_t:CDS:1 [Cetraspora pellucida]
MPVRHLSDDLIHDILQYLREDQDALYNSLCVNRFWSSQVVPLLWCQPFVNCPLSKRHLLIRTYISCFNTDELTNLSPYKINLAEVQPTLFDYSRYLESISDCHLNSSVLDWVHKQINQKFSDFPVGAITSSLWHMFLRKCVKIQSILISPHYYSSHLPTLKSTLVTSTAIHSLRCLEIVIDQDFIKGKFPNTVEIFKQLSLLCVNIEYIEIKILRETNPLTQQLIIDIIKAQQNLKEFKLTENWIYPTNIMTSLEVHANHITALGLFSFLFDDTSIKVLSRFTCLESLQLHNCSCIEKYPNRILSDAMFNLKSLFIVGTPSSLTTSIIAKAGHMLQLLVMDCVNSDMIDFASKYCPNISMLYVELTQNDYTLLFPWIGSLQLETLEIKCSVESRNRTHLLSANDSGKFLQLLSQHLPLTLTFLRLEGMEILPEDFNNFSKNCNVPLQTFIIQGILKHYNDDEVLCLISQFATLHKTLELFGIDREVIPQKWSKKLKKLGIEIFSIDDFETLYKSY